MQNPPIETPPVLKEGDEIYRIKDGVPTDLIKIHEVVDYAIGDFGLYFHPEIIGGKIDSDDIKDDSHYELHTEALERLYRARMVKLGCR